MKAILLTTLCLFSYVLSAQQWEEISPIPAGGRDDATAFSINGLGYVVNGSLNGFTGSNNLWCYDPVSDSWTEKAPFPGSPRQYTGTFTINGESYVLCGVGEGNVAVNDCWKYNPETDKWIRIADLPAVARWSVFSFASPFAGYLGSGGTANGLLEDFWKYDPNTNSWTQLANYPGGKCRETACFTSGEKAVVTLGYDSDYNFVNSTYEFNLFSETWKQTSDFPGEGRAYATGGSTGNFGYIAGGTTKQTVFFNDIVKYDVNNGTWSDAGEFPLTGIRGSSSFTIGSALYFVTGLDADLNRISRGWKIPFESEVVVNPLVYPNPSDGKVIIKAPDKSDIRIYTVDGRLYKIFKVENQNTLWIDQLSTGNYLVEISVFGNKTTHRLSVR